ncbi:hypothetical protein [Ruminococcus sp. HUN007]|uniref:hypothetical protein n=1 Tax=Ruminococcus sp. HUN007 TaxID=1514668 RepID=UPI000B0C633B|nr:hypothetical protein [Ruminococcus sp. HUN007]
MLVKDEPETLTVSSLGDNYYSFARRGFYGVKNQGGKVIIEARWKSVDKIEGDHFIVSLPTDRGIRYGIIDNAENVIVPFVYKQFEKISTEMLSAETEREKFVLFDYSGKVFITEEWDRITKNYPAKPLSEQGNYIQLNKGEDFFRITEDSEGRLVMSEIRMYKWLFGEKKLVRIHNTAVTPGMGELPGLYSELFDRSVEYIGSVFNGDSARVKDLAWGDNYRDLLLEGLNLRGGEITALNIPSPEITDTKDDTVTYVCYTAMTYISPDDTGRDDIYKKSPHHMTMDIHFKKRQNGKLAITKVYASRKD